VLFAFSLKKEKEGRLVDFPGVTGRGEERKERR
jgi:hypothetical protein